MHARPGHILIVDDDPLNRRLLAKNLDSDGHRTMDVDNGFAALTAIGTGQPDLVLLDIQMPGLDGIEVLERIKTDPAMRHIPVIMISGIEDNESVVRCLEAGADDFLPKPFDPAILRARIGAGLNRKRLTDLEQDRVRDVFTRFLPEPIAAEMLTRSDGRASIAPVRLYATVMFVDLRGFTTFADTAPTEQIVSVLNRYQATMGDAVLDHGGTVVDYLGDGLMAAFGAPIETVDHADRAIAAGRDMAYERLDDFNGWLRAEGVEEGFGMGIGLNSGRVMSGTFGSDRRIDYAVIGDTTNTAARIQDLTKQTGNSILLADQTRTNMTGSTDDLVFVDEFEIRGKQSRIKLWTADAARGAHRRERHASSSVPNRSRPALYRIAETASAAQDMQEFYAEIHRIVGELMFAENLYVVLYDEDRRMMNWPFGVDTAGDTFAGPNVWEPMGTGESRGITSYLLRKGTPLLLTQAEIDELVTLGEFGYVGVRGVDWLGVPLRSEGRTVGAMVVQSYEGDLPHTEQDKDLLTFVASHVGSALSRARAIEETRQRNAELALINDVQARPRGEPRDAGDVRPRRRPDPGHLRCAGRRHRDRSIATRD